MSKTTKTNTCPTCKKTECPAGCPGESAASPKKSRKPKAPTAAELLASIRELYALHSQTAKGHLPFRKLAAAWPEVDERTLRRLCWDLDNVKGKIREFHKQRPNGLPTVTIRPEPEPPAPPVEASPVAAAASPCPPEPDPGTGGPATPGARLDAPGDLDDDETREQPRPTRRQAGTKALPPELAPLAPLAGELAGLALADLTPLADGDPAFTLRLMLAFRWGDDSLRSRVIHAAKQRPEAAADLDRDLLTAAAVALAGTPAEQAEQVYRGQSTRQLCLTVADLSYQALPEREWKLLAAALEALVPGLPLSGAVGSRRGEPDPAPAPRPLPVAREKSCAPAPASAPARHPLDGPDNPAPEDLPLVHLSWPHVYLLRALGGLTAPTTAGLELVARELERSARHAREILGRCDALGSPEDSKRLQGQVREAATEYQVALRAIIPGEGLVAIQEPARCLELALEALRGPAPGQVARGKSCSPAAAPRGPAPLATATPSQASTKAPTPSPATPPAAGWTPGPLPVRMPWSWEACRAILATLGRADLWTPAGPTAEARAILEAHPAPGGAEEEGPTPAAALRIALTACAALAGVDGRCDLAEVLSLETAPLRTVALALLGQAAIGEPSALFSARVAELDEAA